MGHLPPKIKSAAIMHLGADAFKTALRDLSGAHSPFIDFQDFRPHMAAIEAFAA